MSCQSLSPKTSTESRKLPTCGAATLLNFVEEKQAFGTSLTT